MPRIDGVCADLSVVREDLYEKICTGRFVREDLYG
jgi:hypothetical protein